MRIKIAYFAAVRDAMGRSDDEMELDSGATVADAIAWIKRERSAVSRLLPTARIAVNQEFCAGDHPLNDGDELVIIPPVSGGIGERVRLSDEAIAADAASALLQAGGEGALVTFTGVVRPTSKSGRAVTRLFYEAYKPMAQTKLQQCLNEAGGQWKLLDLAVVHRLGSLEIGEVAVSIAVKAAHRKEAFAACSYIIDRIKEIVPIWKKETGPDGEEWVSEGA
jgi:molybdopterin synthase catalytic subunit